MKNKIYQNAVEHLRFSDDLYQKVMENAPEPRRPVRILPALVAAVLITVLLASTVLADNSKQPENPTNVEHTVPVETLGTAQEEMTDAKMMELTVSEMTEGVTVHYMELVPFKQYSFIHGMLHDHSGNFLRITEDYTLEPVQMQMVDIRLEKNGCVYTKQFYYLDTERGVLSTIGNVHYKNENGEILINAFNPPNNNWPVYLNVETGEYRDALPDWTTLDFKGKVVYVDELRGGLLVCTLVEGKKNSYNEYHWIAPGATEAKLLNIPQKGTEYVYNDTVFYQNEKGYLYVMDEAFNFRQLTEYKTMDMLTDGLLIVMTKDGKLGIFDVLSEETYIFPSIEVTENDLDEMFGYNAKRYGTDGKIALIQTQTNWEALRSELVKIGVLDLEKGQLQLLQIDNEFDGLNCYWFDANRLGVIYSTEDRQFLCIYEFE